MNDARALRHWAMLAGMTEQAVNEKSDLIGLFQRFRPTGQGLEPLFEAIPLGEALLARLKHCYEATAENYDENDLYFIPRPARRCEPEQAIILLNAHFESLKDLAFLMQEYDLVELFTKIDPKPIEREVVDHFMPVDESPDVWIDDLVTDFFTTVFPVESPLTLLHDAVYSMANDKLLQSYIMWPLYAPSATIDDPFSPYFELWKHGIAYVIPSEDMCLFSV